MHTLVGPDVVGPQALTMHGVLFKVKDLNVSYFYTFYKTHDQCEHTGHVAPPKHVRVLEV